MPLYADVRHSDDSSRCSGHVVKAFAPDGKLLRTVGEVGIPGTGLAPLQFGNVADLEFSADQTKIVFVDGDGGPNNRVVEVDAASLKVVQSWGGNGTADGQLPPPPQPLCFVLTTGSVL